MDIKLKNNRNTRIKIAVAGLLVLTAATLCFFPKINRKAQAELSRQKETAEVTGEINTELLQEIYKGCYVLYLETAQRQGVQTAADVYLEASYSGNDEGTKSLLEELKSWTNSTLEALSQQFENYRSDIDYCVILADGGYEKNTSQELEVTVKGYGNDALAAYYNNYFVMHFDENGILTVEPIYSGNTGEDTLIKSLGQIDRENNIWGSVAEEYEASGITCRLKKPSDFTVVFGVPQTAKYQMVQEDYEGYVLGTGYKSDYWTLQGIYSDAGAQILYVSVLVLIAALVFLMTSRKVWKTDISMERPGNWYLMEAAGIGAICVLCLINSFMEMIWSYDFMMSYEELWRQLTQGETISVLADLFTMGLAVFLIYSAWYLSIRFLRPVFTLGVKEYIRQYSFFYQIFPWMKKMWNRFKDELVHIDFEKGATKTILKIVVINFIILAVCSSLWFFGIIALVVYSVILFFLIERYYSRIEADYHTLLRGVNKIAEGNLDAEITEDLGMFEPFKGELSKIRFGFKKAVDEEVKSQRMKTELITNVSHDLKTPLTAITTYVELLKKEDITEEERRSYIETLEKKSLRLKVLIEDLFEVSKASSNNMTLNLMEVDVVNLMKQVSVEHTDKFEAAGLDLRWNVPEEKVVLMLDNQKTYRIFENLFVNVQKYAMPGSRVYIDVKSPAVSGNAEGRHGNEAGNAAVFSGADDIGHVRRKNSGEVEITIKNMSADELNFAADEITERFVRGDASRNTEGSGLGLAIAKSFTEAQGGKLHVEVDGDLFKVVIRWKCDMI